MSAKAKLLERMEKLHETVELPSGRMKAPMGATHFLLKRIPKVPTEMALRVLAYNLTATHYQTFNGKENSTLASATVRL